MPDGRYDAYKMMKEKEMRMFRGSLYVAMVLSLVACSDKKDSGSGSGNANQSSIKGLVETGINALKRNDSASMEKILLTNMGMDNVARLVKECKRPKMSLEDIKKGLKEDFPRMTKKANAQFRECTALMGDWSTAKEVRREGGEMEEPRKRQDDDPRSKCSVKEYSDFEIIYEVDDKQVLVEFDDPVEWNGKFYIEKIECRERKPWKTSKTGYGGAIKTGYRRYDRTATKRATGTKGY